MKCVFLQNSMKEFLTLLFLVSCLSVFSQEKKDSLELLKIEDTKSLFPKGDTLFLNQSDSLALKIHKEATLIDSLWLHELIKSPLYDTIQFVLGDDEKLVTDLEELPTALLKERLELLNSKTPFNIAYNQQLEQIIKTYLKRRKSSFSVLLERARFYFPLFEEHLDNYDLPLEISIWPSWNLHSSPGPVPG